MSGPLGSQQWMYSSAAGFYPYEIDQSLRLNDDDSAYLSRTPASAGNRKTWTWSGWVKRGNLSSESYLFGATSDNYNLNWSICSFKSDDTLYVQGYETTQTYSGTTNAVFRDVSAWYHVIIAFDTTQATATNRLKLYVNGVEQALNSPAYPAQNLDTFVNRTTIHSIGSTVSAVTFDGYMAEVNFIDGQALDPTDFGEFKSGVWIPKSYSGTYGTNGFYLDFGNSGSLGADSSGNGNDWTANNLAATDQVLDSPTNNFATFNPLKTPNAGSYSECNLKVVTGTSSGADKTAGFEFTSGKWYWEITLTSNGSNGYIGIAGESTAWAYKADGDKTTGGTSSAYGSTYTTNDIISVALDMDAGTLIFYKNNTSQGTAFTGITEQVRPYVETKSWGSGAVTYIANFGQDSSFAGNKTAQGNTDANGIGDFYYAPPSGYLALCTANLPDPAINPALDDVPEDYFNTVLYTGNGSTQSITGVGFQPDLAWLKVRNTSGQDHVLQDSVRGFGSATKLSSSATAAENNTGGGTTDPYWGYISSAGSDGINITVGSGTGDQVNNASKTYVAWNWLAGNGTSSNTDGTITSTVSANQKAGFSIVSYTGTGSASTVGHGLDSAPEVAIVKNRDDARPWVVFTTVIDGTHDYLFLNTTAAKGNASPSAPTSTIINLLGNVDDGASGNDYIAYCFHSVEGFSKFGSYTGNGSTDGPFVYTGFRPAFVMIKNAGGARYWYILDNSRDGYNAANKPLYPNDSIAEGSATNVDLLSNGFKIRESGSTLNESGFTHIYMAFAEMPFKYSLGR